MTKLFRHASAFRAVILVAALLAFARPALSEEKNDLLISEAKGMTIFSCGPEGAERIRITAETAARTDEGPLKLTNPTLLTYYSAVENGASVKYYVKGSAKEGFFSQETQNMKMRGDVVFISVREGDSAPTHRLETSEVYWNTKEGVALTDKKVVLTSERAGAAADKNKEGKGYAQIFGTGAKFYPARKLVIIESAVQVDAEGEAGRSFNISGLQREGESGGSEGGEAGRTGAAANKLKKTRITCDGPASISLVPEPSDKGELRRRLVFRKNVVVVQEGMRLECESLVAVLREVPERPRGAGEDAAKPSGTPFDIDEMIAEDNVFVKNGFSSAKAAKAVFKRGAGGKDTLTLEGTPQRPVEIISKEKGGGIRKAAKAIFFIENGEVKKMETQGEFQAEMTVKTGKKDKDEKEAPPEEAR